MHRAWFTADGRSRVDYGLADVWHYRASNNSWNRERARRREGEEACRNWSLWKENNFDLLSINKNKKHLWVCAGGLRANNRSTGTWNIYNLWQVFRAPVLLRALLNDSGFTSHTAPTQHVELQECKEKLHVCWKKKKNPAAVSASLHEKPGTARMKEEGEERISPPRSPRCFSSTVFNRTRSSWRYRSRGSDQIWVWRETVSVLELNQAGRVLCVSRFPLYRRVCAMKRESIQPLEGAFIKSGL